ncbi:uncharacterized protein LOC121510256 [Cheilinus undulatus]|uniref:uncharacterized protein LOC121510256 n=1 Tax=Cheilinus undulatus TaxID=241271 RepID=UPI001BD56BA0|nr:uncharacterized protein LOC121510256 [Cheilinus undulatus]
MAETRSKCHCSVPLCTSNKQKQPYLSFHGFPRDEEERRKWVQAIRREEGPDFKILRGSTFVCSRHFAEEDYSPVSIVGDRKRLKAGVVPWCFQWNNWGMSQGEPVNDKNKVSLTKRKNEEVPPALLDHNYSGFSATGKPDAAPSLTEEEVQEPDMKKACLEVDHLFFNKFCVSDEEICFHTRFPSRDIFYSFWRAIEPSAYLLENWSKAQKAGQVAALSTLKPQQHRLQLVDEFFLYCCCVAAGLPEKELAENFEVGLFTVRRVVTTWANYLYLLLSSTPIWMSRNQVQSTMPLKFKRYSPDVRVMISCMEVQCQSSSLALQSEGLSSGKKATTFKGLIGIAPCGAVTFVSNLYSSSISDGELSEHCGIFDLLEPGDACITGKGTTIEKVVAEHGATLVITPLESPAEFSRDDELKTQAISQLQILIRRVISRVREFHIWDSPVPLTLAGVVNQLWTNCCLMTNFQGSHDLRGHIPVALEMMTGQW